MGASWGYMAPRDPGSVYEFTKQSRFEDLAWVKASDRKATILQELTDSPRNTSEFAEEWDVTTEAVSHHLKQLEDRGLVEVLTPEREQYRLWGVTEAGIDVVEYL